MANGSKIEWTEATWNPIAGCTPVSPGCLNCYAAGMANRLEAMGQAKYRGLTVLNNGRRVFNGKITLDEDALTIPLHWKKPRRIFVNSMSDLFHENVPFDFVDKVFAVMALSPQHTFQVLTKRPERMAEYLNTPRRAHFVAKSADAIQISEAIKAIPFELRGCRLSEKYWVGNDGSVFTTNGSGHCVWCGEVFDSGQQDSLYCSDKCRQSSAYARKMERPCEPAGRIMRRVKPEAGEQGHLRVHLIGHGRELVHRLVLDTFDRPAQEGEQCCHIDGNPGNCHVANLYWGSQADNWRDRRRHGSYRSYQKLNDDEVEGIRRSAASGHPAERIARAHGISATQVRNIARGDQWATTATIPWPLPNCWLGTSVENQKAADERIPHLLKCPAAVRFLSCEPLLGAVDLRNICHQTEHDGYASFGNFWDFNCENHCSWRGFESELVQHPDQSESDANANGVRWVCPKCQSDSALIQRNEDDPRIHWVIVGGESGPGARPMHPQWARDIRDECQAAGVPFFFKQWGEWEPRHSAGWWKSDREKVNPERGISMLRDGRIVLEEYPAAEQIRRNRAAGRSQPGNFVRDAAALEEFDRFCNGKAADPGYQWMFAAGKKAAGRLLDGRTWDEFPKVGP